MIAIGDVQSTSRWYPDVPGFESGHGGSEYGQLVCNGELVLQLHEWQAHDHPDLVIEGQLPYGNGVVLWFYTENFDGAVDRVRSSK